MVVEARRYTESERDDLMIYFAYGSNMCTGRLRGRVPSATPVRVAKLSNQSLRFHKQSTDGSGKGDAYFTGEQRDVIWGVIFEIDPREKADLDRAEGVGHGYTEKQITANDLESHPYPLFMYAAEATHIDAAHNELVRSSFRNEQYGTVLRRPIAENG
jgi:gamma-glutamylcyclotransferase